MPGVIDKHEGPFPAIIPVIAHLGLNLSEHLGEVVMLQVFADYDVAGVRP